MRSHAKATVAVSAMLLTLAFCAGSASAAAPVVSIDPAAEIGVTSAEAKGEVNPEGIETSWHFEYVSHTQFEVSEWAEASWTGFGGFSQEEAEGILGSAPVAPAVLEGLAPATEYHLRLVAENVDGISEAVAATFETDPATAPSLSVNPATSVSYTTATISGEVDPEGGNSNPIGGAVPIFWQLQYALASEPGNWQLGEAGTIEGTDAESDPSPGDGIDVSANLANLQNDEEYDFRLLANYAGSLEETSGEESFETLTVTPPVVMIEPVTIFDATTAHLSGTVDPQGTDPAFDASWHFEYATQADFSDAKDTEGGTVEGSGSETVEADLADLVPNQTYHVRLAASNQGGESTSTPNPSFTTPAVAPAVKTLGSSHVFDTKARIHAGVNPRHSQTEYWLEWGGAECSANPCTAIPPSKDADAGSGNSSVHVSRELTGLQPQATYHYRVIAKNAVGTSVGEDRSFTTSPSASGCANAGAPGVGFLPDCRAWEMVSPPQKLGNDAIAITSRIRAAADGSAVQFLSLGGFADVAGMGLASEYMAQRTAAPGTNGWATHGITPPQQPLTYSAVSQALEPHYQAEFSADLSKGVFSSFSPLTDAPNVALTPANLYLRDDLRTPGSGSYQLRSDAAYQLPPPDLNFGPQPHQAKLADASTDLEQMIFETRRPLLAPASSEGEHIKLYKSDGAGLPRLISAGPNCPGAGAAAKPCSMAARPTTNFVYSHRTISTDGSRVNFVAPLTGTPGVNERGGATTRLFQLDDQGTATIADDVTIGVSASERSEPAFTQEAHFGTASANGGRVFFSSGEQLTDAPGGGLYMWERKQAEETQELAVDATGGSFTLTAHMLPTVGMGDLTEGSNEVSAVTAGSFMIGQTLDAPGIPAGTKIEKMGAFSNSGNSTLTLTQAATTTAAAVRIDADVQATTPPLPFNVAPAEVEAALEALADGEGRRLVGEGNVEVSGGPGSAGAASPYEIVFTGALRGVNVRQLSAGGSGLGGGAASATVTTTEPVSNLTRIAAGQTTATIGASDDGHHLYFGAGQQLVPGAPALNARGIYYWQDADGAPGGTLSFIGDVGVDVFLSLANFVTFTTGTSWPVRVTPDGSHLLFEASDGSGLAPGYDHNAGGKGCGNNLFNSPNGCAEAYLYRAETSTPTEPDLICASCNPSGAPATSSAWFQRRVPTTFAGPTTHLSHALSDDGRYLFFSTAEKLVNEDSNGLEDVYLYDSVSEEPRLLSSGESTTPSYLADASADGRNVFILTRERLSGWDTDNQQDIYDARVGGGLPEPPPPPPSCQGDACQPAPAQLNDRTPASSAFSGPGDPNVRTVRRRSCPRGTRKAKTRNGKRRCVKRRAAKNDKQRRANTNRRAGR